MWNPSAGLGSAVLEASTDRAMSEVAIARMTPDAFHGGGPADAPRSSLDLLVAGAVETAHRRDASRGSGSTTGPGVRAPTSARTGDDPESGHGEDGNESSSSQELICVDSADREVGFAEQVACHAAPGLLHRAFSIFLFDESGRVLIQRRSGLKPLWPHYWSNSCCSHPRRGESVEEAASRRLREELGLSCPLEFLYKFEYTAAYDERWVEHELCWVLAGRCRGRVAADRDEVGAWRFVTPTQLSREIAGAPDTFTPWCKLEWPRVQRLLGLGADVMQSGWPVPEPSQRTGGETR